MKLNLKSFIVGIALLCAPSFAVAACAEPPISDDDLIIQLKAGTHGKGFIGNKTSSGARSSGAVYFDDTEGTLVGCDGTDWVVLLGSGGAGSGTDGADQGPIPYKSWPDVAVFGYSVPYPYNVTADIGFRDDEIGYGDFTVEIVVNAEEGARCDVEILTADGWVYVDSIHSNGSPDNTTVNRVMRIARQSDGSYQWFDNSSSFFKTYEKNRGSMLTSLSGPFYGQIRTTNSYNLGCQIRLRGVERLAS